MPHWLRFWLGYCIGTIAVFVYYYRQIVAPGDLDLRFYLLFVALYVALLLLVRTKWEAAAYIAFTVLIAALDILLHAYGVPRVDILLWPLFGLVANMPSKHQRLSAVLVLFTGSVIFIIGFKYPFPVGTAVTLIGLYLGIRSRRIRREAYALSKLHLKQLNEAYSDLKRAHDELQEASVYSVRYAALAERTRIAREIHDGLGHNLTSLIIKLQALEVKLLQKQDEESAARAKETITIAREGMKEVRRAVHEWADDDGMLGLAALKGLISQTEAHSQLKCEFIQNGEISEWPVKTSVILYRILQESVTNALRHAKAGLIIVEIREEQDKVIMTVSDNGSYTGEPPLTPGFGIGGMIERCRSVGGTIAFAANRPHGLTIEAVVPLV